MGELEECGRGGKGADGPKREVHGGHRRCQVHEKEGETETFPRTVFSDLIS